MTKITQIQKRTFEKLSETEWRSSYEIGESLKTLQELAKKKMVKTKYELGSGFSPRTAILWKRSVRIKK